MRTILSHQLQSLALALALAAALIIPGAARADDIPAGRVHVLLVCDTHSDEALTIGFDLDRDRMAEGFTKVLCRLGLREGREFTVTVLDGDDVTPDNVRAHYTALEVGPDDALVFYYTGHGALPERGRHLLAFRRGLLPRAELRDVLLAKQPRLAVILTDCCAGCPNCEEPPRQDRLATPRAKLPPAVGRPGGPALGCLLLRHRGLVDVSSSSEFYNSAGKRDQGGSYFTVALGQLLGVTVDKVDIDGDGFAAWEEYLQFLSWETQRVSLQGHGGSINQVPWVLSHGQPSPR